MIAIGNRSPSGECAVIEAILLNRNNRETPELNWRNEWQRLDEKDDFRVAARRHPPTRELLRTPSQQKDLSLCFLYALAQIRQFSNWLCSPPSEVTGMACAIYFSKSQPVIVCAVSLVLEAPQLLPYTDRRNAPNIAIGQLEIQLTVIPETRL